MVRRKRDRGSNRRGVICISAIVLVLLVVLFMQSTTLRAKNSASISEEEKLTAQIESENQRTKDIEDLKAYMETKEYAEEVARDKLGLVYEDEILFKSQD